jgi:tRNA threonylcarbamoyl adenosine modification protein (Sua5/YciO/YrdC/YwlC family)
VILPTDTVYGLCVTAFEPAAVGHLRRLKERPHSQPIALLAAELEALFDAVPELRGAAGVVARALLPGPYTLVLANPRRRFEWLTGDKPGVIGVRVPELDGAARAVVERVGAVAATSANKHGGPDPRRLDDVPHALRSACAAVLDGGELPGAPSTVIDATGAEPRVVRAGAVAADEALARVRDALA